MWGLVGVVRSVRLVGTEMQARDIRYVGDPIRGGSSLAATHTGPGVCHSCAAGRVRGWYARSWFFGVDEDLLSPHLNVHKRKGCKLEGEKGILVTLAPPRKGVGYGLRVVESNYCGQPQLSVGGSWWDGAVYCSRLLWIPHNAPLLIGYPDTSGSCCGRLHPQDKPICVLYIVCVGLGSLGLG